MSAIRAINIMYTYCSNSQCKSWEGKWFETFMKYDTNHLFVVEECPLESLDEDCSLGKSLASGNELHPNIIINKCQEMNA
jgi:hypothetical protein